LSPDVNKPKYQGGEQNQPTLESEKDTEFTKEKDDSKILEVKKEINF